MGTHRDINATRDVSRSKSGAGTRRSPKYNIAARGRSTFQKVGSGPIPERRGSNACIPDKSKCDEHSNTRTYTRDTYLRNDSPHGYSCPFISHRPGAPRWASKQTTYIKCQKKLFTKSLVNPDANEPSRCPLQFFFNPYPRCMPRIFDLLIDSNRWVKKSCTEKDIRMDMFIDRQNIFKPDLNR